MGAMANYGSSPGTVKALSANAFITNTVAVSANANSSATGPATKDMQTSTSTYTSVDSSAGNVYSYTATNAGTSACYLMFYNSSTPTIGTTASIWHVALPATASYSWGANSPDSGSAPMFSFSSALSVAATTTFGGSTVCGTAIDVSVAYK